MLPQMGNCQLCIFEMSRGGGGHQYNELHLILFQLLKPVNPPPKKGGIFWKNCLQIYTVHDVPHAVSCLGHQMAVLP